LALTGQFAGGHAALSQLTQLSSSSVSHHGQRLGSQHASFALALLVEVACAAVATWRFAAVLAASAEKTVCFVARAHTVEAVFVARAA
jgi:hypothetical protein